MFESVFSVIAMIAVIAVFVFFFFVKKREGKDWIYAVYFITALSTGIVLYYCGISYKNDSELAFSPLFILSKAITSALKAFSGDFQLSSISALAQDNALVHIAVFVHFIGSLILTYLIAVKLFGKNMINRLRVRLNSFRSKYIVVGATGQADTFLNGLDYKKKRRTTVILEQDKKALKKDLMHKGFAVVVIKDGQPSGSVKGSGQNKYVSNPTYAALERAGFRRNKFDTKIIAMSENDELNLLVAKIVTGHIKELIGSEKNDKGRIVKLSPAQEQQLDAAVLSAHIMYGTIDRAEHFAFSEYALGRVRFFNPYEMRARRFILENPVTALIPPEWINTSKARLYNKADDGHRTYRIGNIFVGYGKANRQLLKKSICGCQVLGTDYNALVIDASATKLKGQFQNAAPGLFEPCADGKDGEYYPDPEEKYNIDFADLNVLTADFYNRIIREIGGDKNKDGLDFVSVVIALGDDKLGVETALELRQKLYEKKLLFWDINGVKRDRVRIFVKINKETVLSDYDLLNDKNSISSIITVFGASHEVLNENYIIHGQLDLIAKRIANDYWQNAGRESQKTNAVSKWDSLTEFKRESNRYAAMSVRTKLNLLGFNLTSGGETDDQTKQAYLTAYDKDGISDIRRKDKENGKFTDFAERDNKGKISDNARNNLARLEHQRWNTVHLLSGWTKLPKSEVTAANGRQDELSKKHACITTFEGLTDLRRRQADEAIAQAKLSGETLPQDAALLSADTVCYDFDVMDRLFGHLDHSGYKVTKN